MSNADFARVVKWLLVFIACYSIIGHLDPSGLESVLFDLARGIKATMESDGDVKALSRSRARLRYEGKSMKRFSRHVEF